MPHSAAAQEQYQRDKAQALDAVTQYGSVSQAAQALEIPRQTLYDRYRAALRDGMDPPQEPFEVEFLPDELPSAQEILDRRKAQYARKKAADDARRLIRVEIRIDGPFGICHLGDPHVDDDGTDVDDLERHVKVVKDTEGLFGANVGDNQNNWIGRLARLYGEQSTSAAEAWVLTEWLVTSLNWLYILGGNHDCWSGAGDPIKWMTRHQQGVSESWGARLNLVCPNGKEVRINARHDFPGHSMWNTVHGASKAAQMGWRDHVLTCGHKHTSGYAMLKCPATGLVTHALRVAGFKILDRYAKEMGLPNQNISPSSTTIIDPRFADDDPRLITVIHDVEEAADYLTWKRAQK